MLAGCLWSGQIRHGGNSRALLSAEWDSGRMVFGQIMRDCREISKVQNSSAEFLTNDHSRQDIALSESAVRLTGLRSVVAESSNSSFAPGQETWPI